LERRPRRQVLELLQGRRRHGRLERAEGRRGDRRSRVLELPQARRRRQGWLVRV
jgi:hypothetical protein